VLRGVKYVFICFDVHACVRLRAIDRDSLHCILEVWWKVFGPEPGEIFFFSLLSFFVFLK